MEKLGGIICVLIICSSLSVKCSEPLREEVEQDLEEILDQKENGGAFGYEVLISELEHLKQQFAQQQMEMKKQNELINSKINKLAAEVKQALISLQKNLANKFVNQDNKINEQNDRVKQNLGNLEKADKNILTSVASMGQAVDREFEKVYDYVRYEVLRSCALPSYKSINQKTLDSKVSGLYLLKPLEGKPFIGHCEQDKFGGGWLTFQHRFDGSLNFYRNWTEYKDGFGQPDGEFWLGLERLHQLTKGRSHSLLVEMEDFDGKEGYAMYDGFEVANEQENYALKVVGNYSGTAGESLHYHKNMNFSTFDNDNDSASYNCAAKTGGAWWYKDCHVSNLNGVYKDEDDGRTNHWYEFNQNRKGLKVTRMMIRDNYLFSLFSI